MVLMPGHESALRMKSGGSSAPVYVSRDGVTMSRNDGTVVAGDAIKEKAGILQRKQQIEKLGIDIVTVRKKSMV